MNVHKYSFVRHAVARTTLGDLLLVADERALSGCYFPQHTYPPAPDSIGVLVEVDEDEVLSSAAAQIGQFLHGQRRYFDLELQTAGDAFNRSVWELLLEIPYGATTTYGDLAEQLGNRQLAQRVGQAVGHNPISIVVPCHRVLGADGSLTGFAGGLARKRALLDLEEPAEQRALRLF